MYTAVLKYGVVRISANMEAAREQMDGAHRYYNALVELYRDDERRKNSVMEFAVPALGDVMTSLDRVNSAIGEEFSRIRAVRQSSRKKDQPSPEDEGRIEALKAERKALWDRRNQLTGDFNAMLAPARVAYKSRTSGLMLDFVEEMQVVKVAIREARKKSAPEDVKQALPVLESRLEAMKAEAKSKAPPPRGEHGREALNLSVALEMFDEPWPEQWKDYQRVTLDTTKRQKELRAESGLSHGTYVATELAVAAARKMSWKSGEPVKFRRYEGGRKIGRQLAGMTMEKARSATLEGLQIVTQTGPKRNGPNKQETSRGRRCGQEFVTVSFRVGKGRDARLVSCDVKMHRPLPPDAKLLWVYLVPRRIGLRTTYTLQLTVKTKRPLTEHTPRTSEACHVELGWATSNDGLVVARVNGKNVVLDRDAAAGKHGSLSGMEFARGLRGIADGYFEGSKDAPETGARTALEQWLKQHPGIVEQHGWLSEMTEHIGRWRAHGKLAAIALRWSRDIGEDRVRTLWRTWKESSPTDLYEPYRPAFNAWLVRQGVSDEFEQMGLWLEWWRRKDAHLIQWSANLDTKARGNRLQQYRTLAAKLAREYETCTIKEVDLAGIARRKEPGRDADDTNARARRNRFDAAPSILKDALKAAFGPTRFFERHGEPQNTATARKGKTPPKAKEKKSKRKSPKPSRSEQQETV